MEIINSRLEVYRLESHTEKLIPVLPARVKAGGYGSFESPAIDFPEDHIDLVKYLIKDADCTFFGRVTGDSMSGIGIYDQDLLIIQKNMRPRENDSIVVFYQGEFFVKIFKPKFRRSTGQLEEIQLCSQHPDHAHLYISSDEEFELWGVARFSIRNLR